MPLTQDFKNDLGRICNPTLTTNECVNELSNAIDLAKGHNDQDAAMDYLAGRIQKAVSKKMFFCNETTIFESQIQDVLKKKDVPELAEKLQEKLYHPSHYRVA